MYKFSVRMLAGLGLTLAMAAVSLGCGNSHASKPNVVLITIDTLRADRLGSYGYEWAETPNLDRLAREGVLFSRAYSQVPLTLPSHASLLTGLYPPEHGSRLNGTYTFRQDLPTLATILDDEGYATGAFVSASVLSSSFGLNAGFDRYDDIPESNPLSIPERPSQKTVTQALKWLEDNSEGPFFLWLHLFDPHYPYTPEAPNSRTPVRPPAAESSDGPSLQGFRIDPNPAYDGEVTQADAAVGDLIAHLEERELLDETLVIATSDHGESLGEHGERTHGILIYDSTMRVPLIIRPPGDKREDAGETNQGREVAAMVELIDIVPTVLAALGLEAPRPLRGIDLLQHPIKERPTGYGESLSALAYRWSPLYSWRESDWKYIKAPQPELFDTNQDPNELSNRIDGNTSRAHTMDQTLTAFLEESEAEGGGAEATRQWKDLESLGYLGGAIPDREQNEELSWPDPKQRMRTYNQIMDVSNLLKLEQPGLTLKLLLPLLETESENPYLRKLLGRAYLMKGDPGRAIREFRRYYELSSKDLDAVYYLAMSLTMGKQHDEARQVLKTSLEAEPRFVRGWEMLSIAHASAGDIDAAIQAGERVFEIDPGNVEFYLQLGRLCMGSERFEKAEELFSKALALNPDNAAAKAYLAKAQAEIKGTGT